MKKLKLIIGLAALLASVTVQGQTNEIPNLLPPVPASSIQGGLQEIGQAVASSTNWTVLSGYGRSLSDNRNLAFGAVAYNFNQNVGIVLGYDRLWANGQPSVVNAVKGGITLSAKIHPFAFLGSPFFSKLEATPFVADLLATPRGNGNALGNIVTTGVNFDVYSFKNFELGVGAQYEKRMGQGFWDGNYGVIHVAITRKW